MSTRINDLQFSDSIPRWVSLGIFLPTVVAIPIGLFLLIFISQAAGRICLTFGFFTFSVSTICFTYYGVRRGFLPGRFNVSRSTTPIRFWLTIATLSCFAIFMLNASFIGFYG